MAGQKLAFAAFEPQPEGQFVLAAPVRFVQQRGARYEIRPRRRVGCGRFGLTPRFQVNCGDLYFLTVIHQQFDAAIQLVGDIEHMFL